MTLSPRYLPALLLIGCMTARAEDITELDYPREEELAGGTLRIHHPVIEVWEGFRTVEGWVPIEVRPAGSRDFQVGALRARASTRIDLERRLVRLSNQEVLEVRFSSTPVPPAARELAAQAVRNRPHTVLLDALLRSLAEDFEMPPQARTPAILGHAPPRIEVVDRPTRLMLIDKLPVAAPITGTGLEFVVNTDWQLFHEPRTGRWYVLNEGTWQTHTLLATGGWTTTTELPADFRNLALGDQWTAVRDALPARQPAREPPPFIVSLEPAELIVIDGAPRLEAAGHPALKYVANTERDLFEFEGRWYFLAAGRWFEGPALDGPWHPVSQLPGTFAAIPEDHPRAHVRAAVPGTIESLLAIMEATLPRRHAVGAQAAARLEVGYVGPPRFEPIAGTALERAVNSPNYVFRHNNFYYLCEGAAWFLAADPAGPWSPAHSVPAELYRIPATDPAYFVTFVAPAIEPDEDDGRAWFEYNSGYLGEYSTGVTVVHGTGWYYTPWLWHDPRGFPVYWSHPYTYGWHLTGPGPYSHRFYYHGGYWGARSITLASEPVGLSGPPDPSFQDPRLARRGHDYSTIDEQRQAAYGASLSADDDYYTDREGNVYRRQDDQWSRHTGSGWSTMEQLERQYGGSSRGSIGAVGAAPQQQQAYKQDPEDIARMQRYYESRRRSYNMYGHVYVGR